MTQEIANAVLQEREERRLLRGHLWAYRNEFQQLPELADGALVDVFSAKRRFIGRGFYQAQGGIGVRLLSFRQCEIDSTFFKSRIEQAAAYRDTVLPGHGGAYRWIFGESDGLPGLVIDHYGVVAVGQSAAAFYAERADVLAEAVLAQPGLEGFVLHLGQDSRRFGEVPEEIACTVEGIALGVQLGQHQKTGLFLDQRLNAAAVRKYAKDARVFDGHCYVGQWACHAAQAGAASVLAVDTSAAALEQAERNAQRNGVESTCTFTQDKVETALEAGEQYDVVILDPPAFAKSRKQAGKSLARYQALNRLGMAAVRPGGYLITSSCSHFVDNADFLEQLKRAATAAQRRVWLIEMRGAAPDHPVLLSMPETGYLKCAVLRVF